MRNTNNQGGVLAALSSVEANPARNLTGGNGIRFGAGGVNRNSHQIPGSKINAKRAIGVANASEPSVSIPSSDSQRFVISDNARNKAISDGSGGWSVLCVSNVQPVIRASACKPWWWASIAAR